MWPWILLALASSAFMYGVGRWDGWRARGWRRDDELVAARLECARLNGRVYALDDQLRLVDERQRDAGFLPEPATERMPTNGAGYRPAADLNDSPTRTGVGPSARPQREVRI
jgi:hypothetical protein